MLIAIATTTVIAMTIAKKTAKLDNYRMTRAISITMNLYYKLLS